MNSKITAKKLVSKGGVVIAVIIAFIVFAIGAPSVFLTPSNIVTILKSISITTVIAMGATIGFATGVFDLSFATLATLGAALSVTFIGWYNMSMPVAMIAATLICMLVGVINAIVVVKFHVTAFLATLAMQFVLDGVTS